jgi:stearoyl-CoA desaturase (delta-9 desaturase)
MHRADFETARCAGGAAGFRQQPLYRVRSGVRVHSAPDWLSIVFMAAIHVAALATLAWSIVRPPAWQNVALAAIGYWCSGLSITGGYHRLFTHRSYRCSRVVAAFFLLFGAAAVQNSALTWASDHRRHHRHTDGDDDPYDARQGLWWSHIGWVFRCPFARDYSNVRDLSADRFVAFQHRFYTPLAIVMAAIVPALVACAWNDPLGGFLWAGCIRVVAQYHSAFAINSVAHRFGRRPYSTVTSARDNVFVALLTMGEGYHNFHHSFPYDFRNGARRLDYDPTKWLVNGLAIAGLASDLKRASPEAIARARRNCSRST